MTTTAKDSAAARTIQGVALVVTTDSRLTDARTAVAHHASHESGGADSLALAATQISTGTIRAGRMGLFAFNNFR